MKILIPAGQETNPDDNKEQEVTPTTRTISVTVTNGSNNIGNATVTIGSVTAQTGPRGGAAELENIPDGEQTITASAEGYTEATQTVTIDKNHTSFEIVLTVPYEIAFVDDKNGYNEQLNDSNSGLVQYYTKWPREDGVDANGDPVHDLDTEVVGHSWESAMTAPTDPSETSTWPWVILRLYDYTGTVIVKYDGETKLTLEAENRNYYVLSVPNDLGITSDRLEWGTGNKTGHEFDINLLEVIFE